MSLKNFDINSLTESELKQLNKASQEKLDAIQNERRRKAELKKNYAIKHVPSTYKVDYARLGIKIEEFFKEPSVVILDISSFHELRKRCTDEIKPKREEIYPCPLCGEFDLRVGNFGDSSFNPKNAVMCESCDFVIKKKTDGKDYYAWEIFHEWLIKNGYLDKTIEFQY